MVSVEEAKKDRSKMDEFIKENMNLVRFAIKKLGLNPYDDDYLQEGYIGLIKAVRDFNPEYGYKFSTYAMHKIRGTLQRYRRDFESTSLTGARVPRRVKDIYFRAKSMDMPDDEICKKLRITPEKLNNAYAAMQPCISLDLEFNENDKGEEGKKLHEMISSDSGFEEEIVERITREDFLNRLFNCLNKKQANVLLLHLKGFSQRHIAKEFNTNQTSVSRTLKRIINKGKQIAEGEVKMPGKAKITREQHSMQ